MINFIIKLRKKPEAVRRQIALFVTLGLGLVVILIWVTSLYLTGDIGPKNGGDSPFSAIKKTFNIGQ